MIEACLLVHRIDNWKGYRRDNKNYQPNYVVVSRKNTIDAMYGFPGGKRENDELLNECIQRELYEEVGFNVTEYKTQKIRMSNEYDSKNTKLYSNKY